MDYPVYARKVTDAIKNGTCQKIGEGEFYHGISNDKCRSRASSVSHEYVKIIQENGGVLADDIGIPEDMLRRSAKSPVCKINKDLDLRLVMTAGVRQVLAQKPSAFDPREYLKAGGANVKDLVAQKIVNVLGSDHKA